MYVPHFNGNGATGRPQHEIREVEAPALREIGRLHERRDRQIGSIPGSGRLGGKGQGPSRPGWGTLPLWPRRRPVGRQRVINVEFPDDEQHFVTDALAKLQELEDRYAPRRLPNGPHSRSLARLNHEPRLELAFNLRLGAAKKAREAADVIYAELKAHLQRFNYRA